jgi:hypothetical protein
MSKYRFELFEPSLLDQVAKLRKQLWGRSLASNRAYLRWKYLENPYLSDPLIYVIRLGDEVVGMRGMYGTRWDVPGLDRAPILPCAADSGIRTDHRDSGLFGDFTAFALADLKDRGYRFVINLSATPANYVTSIMTMGWRKIGSYDPIIRSKRPPGEPGPTRRPAVRPANGNRLAQRLKESKRVSAAVRSLRSLRKSALGRDPFSELDGHISRADAGPVAISRVPRPDLMETLAAPPGSPPAIRHARDATYVSWRYGNPQANYRFLFHGRREPAAYFVLQGTARNSGFHLVDWAGEPEPFGDLLDATISLGNPAQFSTWGATTPDAIRCHLSRAGFESSRSGPMARWGGFIAHALSDDTTSDWSLGSRGLLDLDNWDLRMILSDRF